MAKTTSLETRSELKRDLPDSISVCFGDYGVVHPDFSDRGSSKNMNGKIRYTAGPRIRYFRGHRLQGDYLQYHQLATRVRESGLYMGRDFSFGDLYLDDVADYRRNPGSPATWVLAEMNHHFQYTYEQMRRLSTSIRRASSREGALRVLELAVS